MTTPAGPLQNIYYERKVATPRPCYICRRETSTVLATIKTEDFVYTCEGHLSDPASPIAPPPAPTGPSADDIRKVISEYESRQAKKADKGKAKEDGDKDKEKDKDGKDTEKDAKAATPTSKNGTSSPATQSPLPVAAAAHRKFALHRQIWEMRKQEIRRKEMSSKAKEVGKGLPQVPRGNF